MKRLNSRHLLTAWTTPLLFAFILPILNSQNAFAVTPCVSFVESVYQIYWGQSVVDSQGTALEQSYCTNKAQLTPSEEQQIMDNLLLLSINQSPDPDLSNAAKNDPATVTSCISGIRNLYSEIFNRTPDVTGFKNNVDLCASGMVPLPEMRVAFLNSPECQSMPDCAAFAASQNGAVTIVDNAPASGTGVATGGSGINAIGNRAPKDSYRSADLPAVQECLNMLAGKTADNMTPLEMTTALACTKLNSTGGAPGSPISVPVDPFPGSDRVPPPDDRINCASLDCTNGAIPVHRPPPPAVPKGDVGPALPLPLPPPFKPAPSDNASNPMKRDPSKASENIHIFTIGDHPSGITDPMKQPLTIRWRFQEIVDMVNFDKQNNLYMATMYSQQSQILDNEIVDVRQAFEKAIKQLATDKKYIGDAKYDQKKVKAAIDADNKAIQYYTDVLNGNHNVKVAANADPGSDQAMQDYMGIVTMQAWFTNQSKKAKDKANSAQTNLNTLKTIFSPDVFTLEPISFNSISTMNTSYDHFIESAIDKGSDAGGDIAAAKNLAKAYQAAQNSLETLKSLDNLQSQVENGKATLQDIYNFAVNSEGKDFADQFIKRNMKAVNPDGSKVTAAQLADFIRQNEEKKTDLAFALAQQEDFWANPNTGLDALNKEAAMRAAGK